MGLILLRIGCGRWGVAVVSRRWPRISSDAIEELEDLTEAVEIQEVIRPRGGIVIGRRSVVSAAQGDGGMPPVRETDDKIRIISTAEADDLNPLAAERMMGMGNGDESRRRLG
jgi:hypothetical protein